MRVLAGGPARETESDMFRLHVEGLKVQEGFDLTIRHELVPDDDGPRWHHDKIERVAKARQGFLDTAAYAKDSVPVPIPEASAIRPSRRVASGTHALFLVDTDVILGPGVLERMWAVDADVVYGVFWTEADWGKGSPIWPQVWDVHPYRFRETTWDALNRPGVNEIEVLGGGACTLIRGRGFESAYWPLLESIRPLEGMWGGEDRTFALGCETRAVRQVAVTGLPIVHCYTDAMRTPHALDVARREVGL